MYIYIDTYKCMYIYIYIYIYIRHCALEERKGTKCVSNVHWSWSGRGFELIIGTTPPPGWAGLGALARSWADFLWILAPTWGASWSQVGTKI